jgi:hypothetical protein
MGGVVLSESPHCSVYCLSVSERSELVVNLETEAVGARLVLDLGAGEVLVGGDGPVVVHLVINLKLSGVVLTGAGVSLQVNLFGELEFSTGSNLDGEALEALSTVGGVVGELQGAGEGRAVLLNVANAHEMLLEVSTQEAGVVALGGEAELGPESLEVLGVVLKVEAEVVLAFVGEVEALLVEDFLLLVVLNVVL